MWHILLISLMLVSYHLKVYSSEEQDKKGVILSKEAIPLPSGDTITVEKRISATGVHAKNFYDSQGRKLTPGEVGALSQAPKIEPELEAKIPGAGPGEKIGIIIILKNQPQYNIVREVRKLYETELEVHERALKEAEKDSPEKALAAREIHRIRGEMMPQIASRISGEIGAEQATVEGRLRGLGANILYKYNAMNALAARVPVNLIRAISNWPEVAHISEDKQAEANLNVSTKTIRAQTWWNNGYQGGNWNIAVFDTGLDNAHPSFQGTAIVNQVFHVAAQGSSDYNDNALNSDDLQGHGTHVCGIACGKGSYEGSTSWVNHKGIAPWINTLLNLKAGYRTKSGGGRMYHSDCMAAVDWSLSSGTFPDNINRSFGISNSYSGLAQFFDAVVDSYGVFFCNAAGNSGPAVTVDHCGYNGMSVAAYDDMNNQDRSNDVLADFSSRGPTTEGLFKPDIAFPGVKVMAPRHNWEVSSDYVSMNGTSMASPHCAGAGALIMDFHTDPRALKALLINTAEDRTSINRWDVGEGWGYADLQKAYYQRSNCWMGTLTRSGSNRFHLYKGTLPAGGKATFTWNRHAVYNGANFPSIIQGLSDLDLHLFNMANGAEIDYSISASQNVEQVRTSAALTQAVLKVKTWSISDPDVPEETYALAANKAFTRAIPPRFNVTVSAPATVTAGIPFTVQVNVRNTGQVTAFGCTYTIPNYLGSTSLGNITPGSTINSSPSITIGTPGTYNLTARVTSNSYSETFKGSGSTMVTVQ